MGSDSDNDGQWTQVRQREHRKKPTLAAPTGAENKLSPGHTKIVQEAEQRLTTPQRETIEKRSHAVGIPHSFRFGRPCDDDDVSRGEGPSKGKGKGPDPGNWGNIDLSDEDIDLDAQRAALETWKTVREWAHSQGDVPRIEELPDSDTGVKHGRATSRAPVSTEPPIAPKAVERIGSCQGDTENSSEETEASEVLASKKHKKKTHKRKDRTKKVKGPKGAQEQPAGIGNADPVRALVDKTVAQPGTRRERQATPRAMEPVEQINPKSYIGLALTRLNKSKRTDKGKGSPDDSSSSSTSSSSSSDSRSSYSTTSDSDESSNLSSSSNSLRARRRCKSRSRHSGGRPKRSKRKRSRKTKKRQRMTLKPILPTKYDGSVDSKAFHRFITEGTAYVKDGQVPSKKWAFILSHYLTGKAHEFYVREVSGDPYGWRLPEFFRELFNYCFPVDFRIKQRRKLLRCYQNEQKVRDYIYELNELWVMIGETDERTQVHKLWFGLRKEIQHDLWREKLNPEISSLKDVIAAAEIIEIAQSVTLETNGKGCTKTPTAIRSVAATPDGGERAQRRSQRSSRREKKA